MTNVLALPPGTELVGDFRIGRVLGAGGFGMTYLAEEIALARQVTIKEYFPTDFATRGEGLVAVPRDEEAREDFQWGLDRFISEAQVLALFDHPNIVRVYRYFKANGTAYLVLTFEEGQSLKAWLRGLGRAPRQRELDDILTPLLEALEAIHAADFLHRDIAPDNIIIRKDGTPVLIDFGSARGDIARHSRTVSALVKPGYSPYEQYAESGTRQGPWTDIYALGATLYHAISGKRPPDAPSRVVKDELASTGQVALSSYRDRFLSAIDRALVLDPDGRPQSVAAWRGDLLVPDPGKPGWFQRAASRGKAPLPPGAKTVKLTVQPGVAPPPPDAPGAPGQMLDFFEGLQVKIGGAPPLISEPPAASDPVAPSGGKEARSAEKKSREKKSGGKSAGKPGTGPSRSSAAPSATEKLPVPLREQSKPARPKPMRLGNARQVRSFAIKFVIGAAIAGWAIAYKDDMPGFLRPAENVIAKSSPASSAGGGATNLTVARVAAPAPSRLSMIGGHRGGAIGVGFTEDARSIVTAGADATLRVWNASNGANVRTIDVADGAPTAMAVLDRRALTGHADGHAALWDLDTGQRIATYKRGDAAITTVGFSHDGARVIAASTDSMFAVWNTSAPNAPLGIVEAHDGAVTAAAFTDRGSFIASGGEDHAVRLWRAGDLTLARTYRGHRAPITALAFSPDGRYLAAAAADGRIRVWSTSSSSLYRINSANKGRVRGLAFAPTGDVVASAADDGGVQLWHLRQGRVVRAQSEGGGAARALAFAPDGTRAAVAGADGNVRFWDAAPIVRAQR